MLDLAVEVSLLVRRGNYVPESEVHIQLSGFQRAEIPSTGRILCLERAHPNGRDTDFRKQKIKKLRRAMDGNVYVLDHRLGATRIRHELVRQPHPSLVGA